MLAKHVCSQLYHTPRPGVSFIGVRHQLSPLKSVMFFDTYYRIPMYVDSDSHADTWFILWGINLPWRDFSHIGGSGRAWTYDLSLMRGQLYQLSYVSNYFMVRRSGNDPPLLGLQPSANPSQLPSDNATLLCRHGVHTPPLFRQVTMNSGFASLPKKSACGGRQS